MAHHDGTIRNAQWLAVIPLLEGIHIISLAVKPSPSRVFLFFPVVLLSAFVIFASGLTLEDYHATYAVGIKLCTVTLLTSTDILLSCPQRDFHAKTPQNAYSTKAPFSSRLWWALCVWLNPRGVNFAHEPKILPPRPSQETTKVAFCKRQLRGIVPYVILWEFVGWMNRSNPYFYRFVNPNTIVGYKRLWRLAGNNYWFHLAFMIDPGYKLLSIVAVSIGLSKPHDWPDMFTSPREAYTIRRVWG